MNKRRWLIVSNRLPFDKAPVSGALVRSSGGLISAITGIETEEEKLWVGAAPPNMTPEEWRQNMKQEDQCLKYIPIFLSRRFYDSYYNNVSNDVFWPLFHYESTRVKFNWEDWDAYRKVNERFAEAIFHEARTTDLIWIHDYHLFLVPYFLKRRNPRLKVGFFLHIPWPSSEVFRQLPVREEILQSLVCADLVGFHDYSYLRHFASSVHGVLGIESSLLRIVFNGHAVRLGVFPVGIDTQAYQKESKSPEVKKLVKKFKQETRTEYLVLGVDRLDYTKGILKKLHAFREMLRRYPDLVGKVSLLQIAVPSRIGVPEYNQIKRRIDMLVGEINGEFGKIAYVPVHYMFSSIAFTELLALYRLADVLLVTSKRDGMNLVSLEYLAAQDPEAPGEVLLSEFTGAISILSHVVSINPWDVVGTSEAISRALRTPCSERVPKYQVMMDYLEKYTATYWAKSFMGHLETDTGLRPKSKTSELQVTESNEILPEVLHQRFHKAKILLFVGYDGTLTPIVDDPAEAHLSPETGRLLNALVKTDKAEIVVVSGRSSQFIEKEFEGVNVSLVAEHGVKFLSSQKKKWQTLVHTDKRTWYPTAYRIMEDYTARVPNSFIEEKEFCLSWHYRKSPAVFASYQARKLEEDLGISLVNEPATVLNGKKVIEVRTMEANKGIFAQWYMELYPPGDRLIIAIGDDRTDEELFALLSEDAISIKVGEEDSLARYRLGTQEDVLRLLSSLEKYMDVPVSV